MNPNGWSASGGGWGWTSASASATTVIYPTATVSYGDSTHLTRAAPTTKKRTPVEWLRDQIDEMTELAIA